MTPTTFFLQQQQQQQQQNSFIGTGPMESMKRYGVHPSVCPIRPPQQRAAGLLLWARRTGDIDRLLQQRRANVSSTTLAAYVGT